MTDSMVRINLTYAKAHLSEVLNKVEAGQEVIITRHGKEIVRMSPARQPKQPIPLAKLAEFRASMPRLRRPSVELLREMRDEDH
ncbi:MAG: type II toxin-antitoxin system prevent-host-death family antitoxin [Gammaproteobacteria bacterium]|nr:type II toxin-antitoxin system prevent-host-death family antitoxin [Gammaproteobacteria bacterium]